MNISKANEAARGGSSLTTELELRIAKALAYQYFIGLYDGSGMSEEDAEKYASQRAANSTGWMAQARELLFQFARIGAALAVAPKHENK